MALFGLFGKKKKEEIRPIGEIRPSELGLGREHELGLPGLEREMPVPETPPIAEPPGMAPGVTAPQFRPVQQPPSSTSKEMEILSAKMDALKAILDSINQRLIALERIASQGESPHEKYYY